MNSEDYVKHARIISRDIDFVTQSFSVAFLSPPSCNWKSSGLYTLRRDTPDEFVKWSEQLATMEEFLLFKLDPNP